MKVKEAVSLLGYNTAYMIQGAYSGKIYHKSFYHYTSNLDKYTEMETMDSPFYASLVTRLVTRGVTELNNWSIPVIIIRVNDHDLCM